MNRKSMSRYRSGGITLIYKNALTPHIKTLSSESKLILWFTISKQLSVANDDILCGIVYIPPYGSKYSHPDPYLEIQSEFDKNSTSYKNILLFGDFNSRTGSTNDYVRCDPFICEAQGNQNLYQENLDILNLFDSCKVPLNRNNIDVKTNVYGSQLVDFCKYNNIFIVNGRLGSDYTSRKPTCKDRSAVDYILTSAENFKMSSSFQILDFRF